MPKLMSCAPALLLAACATGPLTDDQTGPYPKDYRQIVADAMRGDFFDPFTLQDVWISEPQRDFAAFQTGWMVCVRANGKNRMGAYAGRHETGYLIKDGAVVVAGDYLPCPSAQYTEWTEEENIGAKRQ